MTKHTGESRRLLPGGGALLALALTVVLSGCSHGSSSTPTAGPDTARSTGSAGHSQGTKHHHHKKGEEPSSSVKSPTAPPKVRQVSRDGKPAHPTVSAPPASFHGTVKYSDGLTFQVTDIHQGRVTGQGRGDLQGPKTTFDLRFVNGSSKSVDLTEVVPTAVFGSPARIARPVDDTHTRDFGVKVAAGKTATAAYAFSIPVDQLSHVTIYLDFDGHHYPATFKGSATS
jgi:hypothetical protein